MKTKKNNKFYFFALFKFLFVTALLFVSCQGGTAAEFELIFSNDIRGEIEPCG